MTTTYIGELSIGAVIPFPTVLVQQAQFQLSAQLQAMASMTVQIPNTLADLLALAKAILLALDNMLLHGLQPPTVSLQVAIIAQTIAQLGLQLAPFLSFAALAGTGGVFAYVYDGTTSGAGVELSAALSGGFPGHGPLDHCDMLVLGTVVSATWTAMSQVFKTAP